MLYLTNDKAVDGIRRYYETYREALCDAHYSDCIVKIIDQFKTCLPKRDKRSLKDLPYVGEALKTVQVIGAGVTNLMVSVFGTGENIQDMHRSKSEELTNKAVALYGSRGPYINSLGLEIHEASPSAKLHPDEIAQVLALVPHEIEAEYQTYMKLFTSKANLLTMLKQCRERRIATRELGELLGTRLCHDC